MRRFLHLAALFLPLTLAALSAHAQDAIFNSEVSMDETGTDATDAKNIALKKAEREGLSQLMERLAPDQKDEVMKSLDDKKISAMVKGVEVLDEKIAGNRYRAQLRLSYNALTVSGLIEKRVSDEGISKKVEQNSTGVLIIPVYEENGQEMLWESTNAWRNAWNRVVLERSGGNLIVPYGDSVDTTALSAGTAQSATFGALAPLVNRYGVGQIVILRAVYRTEPNVGIDVVKRDISRSKNEVLLLDYRADPQENKDQLLVRAAQDLAEQLDRAREDMISKKALTSNTEGRVMALIPISTLAAWTEVRQKMMKLPVVTKLEIIAIAPTQVDVLIHFRGDKAALSKTLETIGLHLMDNGNYWVITRD